MRKKLISDHGLFSFYEGQQGAANGQDLWDFFRDAQGLRLDADSRAGFTQLKVSTTTVDLGISILFISV